MDSMRAMQTDPSKAAGSSGLLYIPNWKAVSNRLSINIHAASAFRSHASIAVVLFADGSRRLAPRPTPLQSCG